MIPFAGRYAFYLCTLPTDMRKSFDGLCGLVTGALGQDPMNGAMYIFLNRFRNRMKLLVWDRTGFWIFYKRLEKGTFQLPKHEQDQFSVSISYEHLMMILEGIDLNSIRQRPRFRQLAP
jgi:transposase